MSLAMGSVVIAYLDRLLCFSLLKMSLGANSTGPPPLSKRSLAALGYLMTVILPPLTPLEMKLPLIGPLVAPEAPPIGPVGTGVLVSWAFVRVPRENEIAAEGANYYDCF